MAIHTHEFPGLDWAVLKLKANGITGKLPGHVQGYFIHLTTEVPTDLEKERCLKVVGNSMPPMNTDYLRLDRNKQKTTSGKLSHFHDGFFEGIDKYLGQQEVKYSYRGLYHNVQTYTGNSGSPIIDMDTNEVIGIHTHSGGFGPALFDANLSKMIKKCLESE